MKKINQNLKNRGCKIIMLVIIMFAFILKLEAQTVTPWITSGDKSRLLQQQSNVSFGTNSGSNPSTVTINPAATYQTMDGFGYTLTEGSCEVISGMAATQQNQLLNDLYNPTTGLNANVIRISIAASDLSSSSYSYNETAGDVNMNNFSLNGPDATYLIPILKKILAINPNVKILATPWSAPRWMKTNNSWIGGSLQTQYYAAYAKYFVKYFDAMKAQGISIWGITPQNEPENPHNEPSMLMNSAEQKNFINNNLGPQMATAGYGNIKIIAFDHNCDNTAYPIDVLNNSSYADGAAFHLYSGNISALTTVHNATNKNVYFTEQYTGSGGSFAGDFGWHIQNVIIGASNNWAKMALEWNVANNSSLGPHTPGGCNTCLGAVTINNSTTYTKNVAYYIIGQIAKFVKPGALRVSTSSTNGSITSTAFKNPDGSIALLVYNSGASSNTIKIVSGSSAFDYAVPASSAVTFNWATNVQSQQPYGGTAATIPGVIQAENYDTGGQGVAYNDNETANQGGAYRTNEGVDITAIAGTSGFATGWTATGEWTEYTTNVTAGTYTIEATVATINSGKQLRVLLDGTALATLSIPNTGSWDTYQTVSVPNIALTGGSNKVLRFEIIGGDFNIDKVEIKAIAPVSTLIQAENYSTMSGIQTEATTDTGGGLNVGYADTGDWMAYYNINFPTTGSYLIEYRVASAVTGARISSDLNAGAIQLGAVDVPNTGGWQNWQTISQTVTINAGTFNFGVFIQNSGVNINWIKITKVGTAKQAVASTEEKTAVADNALNVYPNPVANTLFFTSEVTGANVSIVNSQGVKVISQKINDDSVDVSSLSAGVYIIVIEKEGIKTVRRFIKK